MSSTPLADFGRKVLVNAALGRPFYVTPKIGKEFGEAMISLEDARERVDYMRSHISTLTNENKTLKMERNNMRVFVFVVAFAQTFANFAEWMSS